MSVTIQRFVTSGTITIDGEEVPLDNNLWVIGDELECFVIDAPHDAAAVVSAAGGRRVLGLLCTHAHRDHVEVAFEAADQLGANVWLHPADEPVWRMTHPERSWDADLSDGHVFTVAGVDVHVIHTPGHTPGACCFHVPALKVLFSGDTLFQGGPGATGGRPYSDFGTIIDSIRGRLLVLPTETRVLTGHGDETTIGAEAPDLGAWIARGY